PEGGLYASAGAQCRKTEDRSGQGRIRRAHLRVRHGAGAVDVNVEVEGVAFRFVAIAVAPDPLYRGHAGDDAGALQDGLNPIRGVEGVSDVPRLEPFGQGIDTTWCGAARKGDQERTRALAVVANGELGGGEVDAGRAEDLAKLIRLARLARRRKVSLGVIRSAGGRLSFLGGGLVFRPVGQGR